MNNNPHAVAGMAGMGGPTNGAPGAMQMNFHKNGPP